MWFLQNQNGRYGTKTITYFGPKIWSFVPDEIRESASLETFRQKIKLWKPVVFVIIFVAFLLHFIHILI